MQNALAAKTFETPAFVLVSPCNCGHKGRGAHRKVCLRNLVRGFMVANDLTPAPVDFLSASEVGPDLPTDYERVRDVLREGWGRSLAKTLTYGLIRAGYSYPDALRVAQEAVREGWIKPAGGGTWRLWCER